VQKWRDKLKVGQTKKSLSCAQMTWNYPRRMATASHKARTHRPGWHFPHASSFPVAPANKWKLRLHIRRNWRRKADRGWSADMKCGFEECIVQCGAWRVQCEVWSVECEGRERCGQWCVKSGLLIVKFGVQRVQCEVWTVKCEVWSLNRQCDVKCVLTAKGAECGVKCVVWRLLSMKFQVELEI